MTSAPIVGYPRMDPVMPGDAIPNWEGAVWIGEVDQADDIWQRTGTVQLAGGVGYRRARLLVRTGRTPRGLIEVDVVDGQINIADLIDAAGTLPPPIIADLPASLPSISIVLCTYDRPVMLRRAIETALQLDYPSFELVIVDNHQASGLTRPVVDAIADPRLRYVDAPEQGLARARNIGVLAAEHDVIAFTDDDVVVDRWWLQGIAAGFASRDDVDCVCGLVPTGELKSLAQAYFDSRVAWARNCASELFTLSIGRPDEPMFPFEVARFGTGANFALRREFALAIGGFDEGLGVGSPTGGGEDIDIFLRVLLAGRSLAYEPSAVIWHRHRVDLSGLTRQVRDYGTGLGAFLTKHALRPPTLAMMLRRALPGLRHARTITKVELQGAQLPLDFAGLSKLELNGILAGPRLLLRARRAGARGRPLLNPGSTSTVSRQIPITNPGGAL